MVDDELRTLLSIEPSPALASKVRARVQRDQEAARWHGPRPIGIGVAATLAVVAGIVLLPVALHQTEAPPAGNVVASETANELAPLRVAVAPVGPDGPIAVVPVGQVGRGGPAAPGADRVTSVMRSSFGTVQIDRAEALALQRLFASAVDGVIIDAPQPSQGDLVIPQIAIEPLTLDIRSEGASQ